MKTPDLIFDRNRRFLPMRPQELEVSSGHIIYSTLLKDKNLDIMYVICVLHPSAKIENGFEHLFGRLLCNILKRFISGHKR